MPEASEAAATNEVVPDPIDSAKAVGLRYVSDNQPGIHRRKSGDSFRYVDVEGKALRDPDQVARIKRLAIPPAWTDVWICASPNGHLQATGRDARGRKQYRYHQRYRAVRDETKYEKMFAFAEALPKIRRRTEKDLRRPGLPREKVLATVVRLLSTTYIRVGNEEYAKNNQSYGLSTMRDRHVEINGSKLVFNFRGKSGKQHEVGITDSRLAKIVKRCRDIPGRELFQYIDGEGERQSIDSGDVNEYLREITGEAFTAKDFRTFAGTVLAAKALSEVKSFDSEAEAKRNVLEAIEKVAQNLGNTPAISRKCYIHPEVIDAYMEGSIVTEWKEQTEAELRTTLHTLSPEEAAVMAFLRDRLAREERAGKKKGGQDLTKALGQSIKELKKPGRIRKQAARSSR